MDPRLLFFACLAALLCLAQTLGLAGSEALFLSRLGAGALAPGFVAAAVVAVGATLLYAAVVGRVRNDRLLMLMLGGTALGLLALLPLLARGGEPATWAVFCVYYAAQSVFTLHFRTTAVDYFDTREAKRAFPLFAVCASAGGALGGAAAGWLGQHAAGAGLIGGWALVLAVAAGWILGRQRALRAARPLDDEEADESSTEGLRSALRHLQRSELAAALAAMVVAMVVALSLLHYLSARIFVARFPDEAQLASFFGLYLALSNLLEIAIGALVTPRLLTRAGVARGGRVHPIATILAAIGLGAVPGLPTALLARADRELLENALGGEVRHLAYGAVPLRVRGALRALLEGALFYASVSLAGAVLWLAGDSLSLRAGAGLALVAAVLYALAARRVERFYGRSLADELARGRLDLELAGLRDADLQVLAGGWEQAVGALPEGATAPLALRQMAERLADLGELEPLRRVASTGPASLRAQTLRLLSERGDPSIPELGRQALGDDDPEVRRAGARALSGAVDPASRAALRRGLDPGDPAQRAACASALSEEGDPELAQMLAGSHAASCLAAIGVAPRRLSTQLEALAGRSAETAIRAAALERLAALGRPTPAALGLGLTAARAVEAPLRQAGCSLLAAAGDPQHLPVLGDALDDPRRSLRERAAACLVRAGTAGAETALEHARSGRRWTAAAALDALDPLGPDQRRPLLARLLQHHAELAALARGALSVWVESHSLSTSVSGTLAAPVPAFRAGALLDAAERHSWIAFRVLEQLADRRVVRSIERVLARGSPRRRADALEALSELEPRKSCKALALLGEADSDETTWAEVRRLLALPGDPFAELARRTDGSDVWLALALAPPETLSQEDVRRMSQLLALQQVPLFGGLGLDQLDAIASLTRAFEAPRGEILMREGEPGRDLQVLLEGEVRVVRNHGARNERELARMRAIAYFGEIAILDGEARSATIEVVQDAKLLALDGERFRELVLQVPEIGLDVIRALSGRLRRAEALGAPAAQE